MNEIDNYNKISKEELKSICTTLFNYGLNVEDFFNEKNNVLFSTSNYGYLDYKIKDVYDDNFGLDFTREKSSLDELLEL